jgi:cytidine deaminase
MEMTMSQPKTAIERDALVEAARRARELAYAPYSGYRVGAAVLADDGSVYTGCNVENASYPASICAERVAITKAISEGQRDFLAIAVITNSGGFPCGICRQVMFEFGPEMLVLTADTKNVLSECTVSDLLPDGFGPEHLID